MTILMRSLSINYKCSATTICHDFLWCYLSIRSGSWSDISNFHHCGTCSASVAADKQPHDFHLWFAPIEDFSCLRLGFPRRFFALASGFISLPESGAWCKRSEDSGLLFGGDVFGVPLRSPFSLMRHCLPLTILSDSWFSFFLFLCGII